MPIFRERGLNPEDVEGLTEHDPHLELDIFDYDIDEDELECVVGQMIPNEKQDWFDHWMKYMRREGSGVID